jgi:hypothetical protein
MNPESDRRSAISGEANRFNYLAIKRWRKTLVAGGCF